MTQNADAQIAAIIESFQKLGEDIAVFNEVAEGRQKKMGEALALAVQKSIEFAQHEIAEAAQRNRELMIKLLGKEGIAAEDVEWTE